MLSNPEPEKYSDFGMSMAIDGGTLAIGAELITDSPRKSGCVFVFCDRGGDWKLEKKLTAPDGTETDQFGKSISVYGDLTKPPYEAVVAVGAPGSSVVISDSEEIGADRRPEVRKYAGAVYIFSYKGVGAGRDSRRNAGEWKSTKLVQSDPVRGDKFGCEVAVCGSKVVAGAIYSNLYWHIEASGAAFPFDISDFLSEE
jgi:hypothetical protein